MFNLNGTGDFVLTQSNSMPLYSLPGDKHRPNVTNAEMAAVYATRNRCAQGGYQLVCYRIFVLSRKLDNYPQAGDDGFTPVTLRLPFALSPVAGVSPTITRLALVANPRANNLDADNVKIESAVLPPSVFHPTFVLDDVRGVDARGLPPAGILLYRFDFFNETALPPEPQVTVAWLLPAVGPPANVSFYVHFDRGVTGFGPSGLAVSGTAFGGSSDPSVDSIVPVGPSTEPNRLVFGSYLVNVTNMRGPGTVILAVQAGAAHCEGCAPSGSAASVPAYPGADTVVYGEGDPRRRSGLGVA